MASWLAGISQAAFSAFYRSILQSSFDAHMASLCFMDNCEI